MNDEQALAKINQRRKQMHVHSVMYYFLHTNVVSDADFDKWALELVELQKQYPQFKHKGYAPGLFADWTGDTGMHLTVTDWALAEAQWLIDHAEKIGHTV